MIRSGSPQTWRLHPFHSQTRNKQCFIPQRKLFGKSFSLTRHKTSFKTEERDSTPVLMVSEEDNIRMGLPADTVWEAPQNPPKPDDYIFVDGKRLVRPYFFEFVAHVKQRWAGKKIEDVFAHEFRARSIAYFVRNCCYTGSRIITMEGGKTVEAIRLGRIRVDDKLVSPGYIVQTCEKLSHFVHRHEPPVLPKPVTIFENGLDVVIVSKPASVPVHPCGQYRKNTVVGILEAEHGLAPLYPIHRLDRLVSGLLIFAKNSSTADRFREEIAEGKVQKEYVAKVRGIFPEEEVEVNANVDYDAREGRSTAEEHSSGNGCPPKGKKACTRFVRLCTDGLFSIVKCMPVTGRTHQIRVHLQHLGHPIANDAIYCHEACPDHGTVGTTNDRMPSVDTSGSIPQLEIHAAEYINKYQSSTGDPASKSNLRDDFLYNSYSDEQEKAEISFIMDPLCTNCPNLCPSGYGEQEEGLWLHCSRYSGPNWVYECPLPEWASIEKQKRMQVVHD